MNAIVSSRATGLLRIVVPDLEAIVSRYLRGEIASTDFVDCLDVAYKPLAGSSLKRILFPLVSFPHKCMYDKKSLPETLSTIGFVAEIRERFESDILDIEQIEIESRTDGAVIAEATK